MRSKGVDLATFALRSMALSVGRVASCSCTSALATIEAKGRRQYANNMRTGPYNVDRTFASLIALCLRSMVPSVRVENRSSPIVL